MNDSSAFSGFFLLSLQCNVLLRMSICRIFLSPRWSVQLLITEVWGLSLVLEIQLKLVTHYNQSLWCLHGDILQTFCHLTKCHSKWWPSDGAGSSSGRLDWADYLHSTGFCPLSPYSYGAAALSIQPHLLDCLLSANCPSCSLQSCKAYKLLELSMFTVIISVYGGRVQYNCWYRTCYWALQNMSRPVTWRGVGCNK